MKKLFGLFLCLVAGIVLSCASSTKIKPRHLYDCDEKTAEAIEKFHKKRFSAAQFVLSEVITNCPGFSAYDTAVYYLGKSWLAAKKPDEAKLEFERLVQIFPNSAFYEESLYLLGYSSYLASNPWYLDQESTDKARQRLKEFIETHPASPYADSARFYIDKCIDKLAQKEFEAARFYEKTNHLESAIVYFNSIIQTYPQSQLALQARLSIAADLIILNRASEAKVVLNELLEQTKDESILKKAKALEAKISTMQ